jgi:hypothetical protein
MVLIDEGGIAILTVDDPEMWTEETEICSWTRSEWEEDPSVVAVIANALRIYYTMGPAMLAQTVGKVLTCALREDVQP